MNINKRKVRALGLCSGGLDSTLAGVVLRDLGIEAYKMMQDGKQFGKIVLVP